MRAHLLRGAGLALTLAGWLTATAPAQPGSLVEGQIRAVQVRGTVWQVFAGGTQKERLQEGAYIRPGATLETMSDGRVLLLFDNGSTMNIQPGTKFSIGEFLRNPFDPAQINYQDLKKEPSKSVTRVRVNTGTILFDIPKLDRASTCEISNPVGTAGIRGTAGFVSSESLGITEGLVQFTTQTGQSRNFTSGQSSAIEPDGSFGPPPPDAAAKMSAAQENSESLSANVPPGAFEPGAESGNASDSRKAAAAEIAMDNELSPAEAKAIAEALGDAFGPGENAAALLAKVQELAESRPDQAAAIAAASTVFVPTPDFAIRAAQTASAAAPVAAAAIAGAVASAVPSAAPAIAAAVTTVVPSAAVAIAQSVSQAVPQQQQAIASAVISAAPAADPAAISSAAQQGAQQASAPPGASGGGDSGGGTSSPSLPSGASGGGGGGSGGGPAPTPTPPPPRPTPTPPGPYGN